MGAVAVPIRLPLAAGNVSDVPALLPIRLKRTSKLVAGVGGAVKSGADAAVLPAMIEL
jgi:hypothetical protein